MSESRPINTGDPWDRLTFWLEANRKEVQEAILAGQLSPEQYAALCREHTTYTKVLERIDDIRAGRDLVRKPKPGRVDLEA